MSGAYSFAARAVTFASACLLSVSSWGASPSPSVGQAIILDTLWQIPFGSDYASTVSPTERDAHAPFFGLFYIVNRSTDAVGQSITGIQVLNRLVNSGHTDHLDSTLSTEGSYTLDGPLGYVWSKGTSQVGLIPLVRMYDTTTGSPNNGDHRTAVEVSPVPQSQSLPDYHPEGPLGYGYARYPGTDVVLAWQTGGPVTVKSNLATGCALWEWWWNGIQFINDYDYGRQMQTAMYPMDSGSSALEEAGDHWSAPANAPVVDNRHPSPCVTYSAGSSAAGNYQTTAAVALDWSPESFGGGQDNPVIYPSVRLGKTITLDWIGPDAVDRNWPVALYQTNINSPAVTAAVVEAPTGYLTAQFSTYYSYSPSTQTLTQLSPPAGTNYNVPLSVNSPQAIIVSTGTSPTSTAMGIYISNANSGFVLYANPGSSGGQYGANSAKWEVHYYGPITANSWTYKTWVMTDTRQNVVSYLNQLYSWNVVSR
jgi:hypothetical protein